MTVLKSASGNKDIDTAHEGKSKQKNPTNVVSQFGQIYSTIKVSYN